MGKFVEWIKNYQQFIKPHAILTDVTGVKSYIINELKDILRSENFSCHIALQSTLNVF